MNPSATMSALAEILASDAVPFEQARVSLQAAGAAKRASGLGAEELDAVIGLVDWHAVARDNTDSMPKALPPEHPLQLLLPREHEGTLAEHTLFDVPHETFTGLVGALRLRAEQVEDAFRWVELGDEDAFERLAGKMAGGDDAVAPPLEATDAIVERVTRLLWKSRAPTTEANAPGRIRASLRRRHGYPFARVIAEDLGLERRVCYGQPNRQFPDPGPLIGLARELDESLFAEALEKELDRAFPAAGKLDVLAPVRWDSVADVVEGKVLKLDRVAAGLRVTGTVDIGGVLSKKGRFALRRGTAGSDASPVVDEAGAKKLLSAWQAGSAIFAGLAATHPELIKAKPLVVGGPDVVAALVPVATQRTLSSALGQLLKQRPLPRYLESAKLIIDALDKVTPKHLEEAARRGHVGVVRALLAKGTYEPKQIEKARAAARAALKPGSVRALS
jgi:hypothetical protein